MCACAYVSARNATTHATRPKAWLVLHARRLQMAYRREEDGDLLEDCVIAFKSTDERAVKQLLSHIRPSVVRTTFNFRTDVTEVSLLHLAAFWGWKDIAILLVAKYDCSATCKDGYDHSPLHYASYHGHLNLVIYFITELHCDPMNT